MVEENYKEYWRLRVKTKFCTITTPFLTLEEAYDTAREYCKDGFWWGAPAFGKAKFYPPNSIEIIEAWRPKTRWDGSLNRKDIPTDGGELLNGKVQT